LGERVEVSTFASASLEVGARGKTTLAFKILTPFQPICGTGAEVVVNFFTMPGIIPSPGTPGVSSLLVV